MKAHDYNLGGEQSGHLLLTDQSTTETACNPPFTWRGVGAERKEDQRMRQTNYHLSAGVGECAGGAGI
ncbi:MAG: hypothetical protein ACLT0Y_00995 [Christensenellales bacterium]